MEFALSHQLQHYLVRYSDPWKMAAWPSGVRQQCLCGISTLSRMQEHTHPAASSTGQLSGFYCCQVVPGIHSTHSTEGVLLVANKLANSCTCSRMHPTMKVDVQTPAKIAYAQLAWQASQQTA